jgi:hypothetical protein
MVDLVFAIRKGATSMEEDRLGRRRSPGQERGLRPMHPELPQAWTSKPVRIAMSQEDWARFEQFAERWASHPEATTQARLLGLALSALMREAVQPAPGPLAWMDWERQKTLRLLRPAS